MVLPRLILNQFFFNIDSNDLDTGVERTLSLWVMLNQEPVVFLGVVEALQGDRGRSEGGNGTWTCPEEGHEGGVRTGGHGV